jgi:hypothetical protein
MCGGGDVQRGEQETAKLRDAVSSAEGRVADVRAALTRTESALATAKVRLQREYADDAC